jgi:hypothetical protein
MFDQILQLVKEHMASNPQLAGSIPPEHVEAVQQEIATHIHENLQSGDPVPAAPATPGATGAFGGILSTIENSLASGGIATSAITGGLVGGLASKFGLPAAVTGAIAAAVPGLLQKFLHKDNA